MGRHQAGRTAGFFPRIGTRLRADGPGEPRGRQSDGGDGIAELSAIPVTQAMAILELITERRAERTRTALTWAERIQLVP